jgi:hypothetical protein
VKPSRRHIPRPETRSQLLLAKDLDDCQFAGTPINETLVNELASGGFVAQQRNVVHAWSCTFATQSICDEAVRGFSFRSPHGPFWRNATRDTFVGSGRIVPGAPDESSLLGRVSREQSEEGGMPRERPRIGTERVDFIRDWIARGAPDNAPAGQIGVAAEPTPPREPAPAPPPALAVVSFARDIRPLFRDKDRDRMLFRFDLFAYDDVKQNATDILDAVASGRMPCDLPWSAEKVALFRSWLDGGALA